MHFVKLFIRFSGQQPIATPSHTVTPFATGSCWPKISCPTVSAVSLLRESFIPGSCMFGAVLLSELSNIQYGSSWEAVHCSHLYTRPSMQICLFMNDAVACAPQHLLLHALVSHSRVRHAAHACIAGKVLTLFRVNVNRCGITLNLHLLNYGVAYL